MPATRLIPATGYILRLWRWIPFFVISVLLYTPAASAGDIHDIRGALVIHISPKGDVYNPQGAHLGRFRTDGTYVDPRGIPVLKLGRDGSVQEPNGSRIATFGSDHVLRDRRAVTIGRINTQGHISDPQGRRLAIAHDIPRSRAAIYWFLLR